MNDKMKKATKEELVTMIADLENQVAELKVKRAKNIKKYMLLNSKIDKKMPKQQIALIVNAPEEGEFTGSELEDFAKESGDLTTVQTPGRIFAWYRNALIDGKYITEAPKTEAEA